MKEVARLTPRKHAPIPREITCKLPEYPYILHRKTMRVRDSSKVKGQRTHVSTLIQSNVYNIITYVYVYNACDCMCVSCVYHERVTW